MREDNIVQTRSYGFAVRVVRLYKHLCEDQREYVLSKQLVRAGTSVGANVEEAIGGQSERDFFAKMSIAYKECRETHYWLRLLRDTDYLEPKIADSLIADADELLRLLSAITRTMKRKLFDS